MMSRPAISACPLFGKRRIRVCSSVCAGIADLARHLSVSSRQTPRASDEQNWRFCTAQRMSYPSLSTARNRLGTSIRQGICCAASLIVENSFVVHRIEAAADPDGTFAMAGVEPCFPGVREDSYSHGGQSSFGAFSCWQPSRLGRGGQGLA